MEIETSRREFPGNISGKTLAEPLIFAPLWQSKEAGRKAAAD